MPTGHIAVCHRRAPRSHHYKIQVGPPTPHRIIIVAPPPPRSRTANGAAMNSFALLQDDVEDASIPTVGVKPPQPDVPKPAEPKPVADETPNAEPEETNGDVAKEEKPEQEKEMTFEEYLAKKKALSSGLPSLNSRGLRQANDGQTPFEKMSVLKKKENVEDGSIMGNVPVKEVQGNKAVKDSTQAAVARNAEIQKFFRKDPNERRPRDARRSYGERRGRGRGDRGRGRGRGRGGNRGDRERYNRDEGNRAMNGGGAEPVPNVDDTAAFPSL